MNLALNICVCLVMAFFIQPRKVDSISTEVFYPKERDALISFRDSLNSTLKLHSKWTGPPCADNSSHWVGVICSNSHIVQLVLEGIQLTGSLPPGFLQNITFLNKLSLRSNFISGPLPSLAGLVHLRSVILSNNRFSSSIPLEFINLPYLAHLELQVNTLTGTIPPFSQRSLTVFNVSNNFLQGPIPETPVLQSFSNTTYDNNLGLCGKPLTNPCPLAPIAPIGAPPPCAFPPPNLTNNKKKQQILTIALIAAAAVLVPFVIVVFYSCYNKRMHGKRTEEHYSGEASAERDGKKMSREDPERPVELEFFDKETPVFDLDDLLRSSAELMGKGQLGTTYKAVLESGSAVTVKRLKEMNGLIKKDFVQQMQLLGKMKHENLAEIISFYYSKEEKLVVYEYIPDGSLFELLHSRREGEREALSWSTRLSIVKGIAQGLAYLHRSLPSHKVPHANLKSSNVLILYETQNQTHQPKLTDFGFLPLLPTRKSAEKLSIRKSPEFSKGKKLTYKADVYCFGVILLEVITGRIPGEFSPGNVDNTDDLSEWVRFIVHRDWSTDILDSEMIIGNEGQEEMLKLTEIALQCTDSTPERRPKMRDVLKRIEAIQEENKGGEGRTSLDGESIKNV